MRNRRGKANSEAHARIRRARAVKAKKSGRMIAPRLDLLECLGMNRDEIRLLGGFRNLSHEQRSALLTLVASAVVDHARERWVGSNNSQKRTKRVKFLSDRNRRTLKGTVLKKALLDRATNWHARQPELGLKVTRPSLKRVYKRWLDEVLRGEKGAPA